MHSNIINRAGWLVAGVLAIFVVAAMTGVVSGGPLDPPGPPAPTQKTLDQIPGSWSQVLAANDGPDSCHSSRFLCVMPGDVAVLDRETGLVWERVPSAGPAASWPSARNTCRALFLGRRGWRLPSQEELSSLMAAGAGHPFTVTLSTAYWTATTVPENTGSAHGVRFTDTALTGNNLGILKTDVTRLRWCVRGGAAEDGM